MAQHSYLPVLSIAGSDSSGGAGIQADIKTLSALGCYAMTAITAVTVQNTLGVDAVQLIDPEVVGAQIDAVFADIRPVAVKIGMLGSDAIAEEVAQALERNGAANVVLDPVIYSTSGCNLAGSSSCGPMKRLLFPIAMLITPNLSEARTLTGLETSSAAELSAALRGMGARNVLITGMPGSGPDKIVDNLSGEIEESYISTRINTPNTHGTGCSLSSAIAAMLARGYDLPHAIGGAENYVHAAIVHGADIAIGRGHGPLNHFFNPQPLIIK